jgi:hypothetical protein
VKTAKAGNITPMVGFEVTNIDALTRDRRRIPT